MKSITSITRRGLMAIAAASMLAGAAPAAFAQDVTIPIIVKDTTSFYWQIVLAGARAGRQGSRRQRAGTRRAVRIRHQRPDLILENAVSGNPAAIVISPTEFKALGKPINEAAKSVKIIGIDSGADSKAFTSFLTTDNVRAAGSPPTRWPRPSPRNTARPKAMSPHHRLPGVGSLDQRARRLQGADRREISGSEARGRQICRRPGNHRPQHR